jgi:hypothetical protein
MWEQEQMSSVPSLERKAQHDEGCGSLPLQENKLMSLSAVFQQAEFVCGMED